MKFPFAEGLCMGKKKLRRRIAELEQRITRLKKLVVHGLHAEAELRSRLAELETRLADGGMDETD